MGREVLDRFRDWAFPCVVWSAGLSTSRKKVQAWASPHIPTSPLRGQAGGDGAGAWPRRILCLSFPEPHSTPSLLLSSLCAFLSPSPSPRKSTPSQTLSSCHAVQSQQFSKHFHFSVLGGGNPIYSLIFHMLRGAVKRPDRGGLHFSGRGSSLLPSLKLYSF